MFALEVEYLTDRVYATDFRERDVPEWPPHPSRLFSAMVAAFHESKFDPADRESLLWLEQQDPPQIRASPAAFRLESAAGGRFTVPKTPRSFVPINDDYSGKFPTSDKRRKERRFPSLTPEDRHVQFIWPKAMPDAATAAALGRIVAQVSYLGHSASLARVSLINEPGEPTLAPDLGGGVLLRVPSKDRLEYLEREFNRSRATRQFRPDAGAVQAYGQYRKFTASMEAPSRSSFGEMIIFQRRSGSPERSEFLLAVTSLLRDALMELSPLQPAPAIFSGHGDRPHLTFAALPFVNHRYADGALKGVAVILPKDISEEEQSLVFAAVNSLKELNGNQGVSWKLHRSLVDEEKTSLQEPTWTWPTDVWSSVTPVLLDRFPKLAKEAPDLAATPNVPHYKPGLSPAEIVSDACRHVGLPTPREVWIHKNSLVLGAPPADEFRTRRRAEDPPRIATHVTVQFAKPVCGPLLLGAGRHFGLGLMLPMPGLLRRSESLS